MSEPLYTAYLKGSLKLSRHGEWFHNGAPFQNPNLIRLFHRSIIWDPERKSYLVRIAGGQAEFDYEDTVYFVTELIDEASPWQIKLNDESVESLDLTSLKLGSDNQIYCRAKENHKARFTRAAHQTLLNYAVSETELKIGAEVVKLTPT